MQLDKIADQPSHELRVYLAAMWYIEQGIYVLPLKKNSKWLPPKEMHINYGTASRKKSTVEAWFNVNDGRFKGGNIGIACGREGGVFAIDFDVKGKKNGMKAWDEMLKEEGLEFPPTPVQKTPSGGYHFLLRWQENAACRTNVMREGIDTRGGDADGCKGHIVAFPSTIDGKMYEWLNWPEIPHIPKWVMEKMGTTWSPPIDSTRGGEDVGADDIDEPIDVDQIQRMLSFIDPNDCDYDQWVRIGMAIKWSHKGPEGLDLWEEWSKGGERYKDNECMIRWNGFSDFGTVKSGTLFYHATEGGWVREKGEKVGNVWDKWVAALNEEYAMIAIGGKLRILREKKPNRITDAHYDLMDRETFTGLLANQRIEVVINGKKKRTSVAEIWLAHEGRRTYENGLGMYPNMDPPDGIFNTWNGFAVEPKEGDCHLFFDHIHKIVCAGDDTINTWVLDWLADLVQDPADPKGCAIVMRGGEGAGKGVLANTVGELFGPHHKHLIDDSHLTSNFNAHLLDAVTLFADEITWGGNKKTAGKLKGMVTEKRLVGERKGVDAVQYDNMVHLMIASNSKWVVPAGSDSRRWMVLDVPTTKRGNVAYFNALFAEIKNGGREAFLWEMLHRGLSSNLRQAPETEALQEQRMLAISQDTTFDWWRECIMKGNMRCNHFKGEVEKWPRLVDKTELYDVYRDHCIGTKMDHDPIHVWAKEMVQYGIQPSRNRRGVEKIYTFKIPTHENAIIHLNAIMAGAIENEDEEDDETDND